MTMVTVQDSDGRPLRYTRAMLGLCFYARGYTGPHRYRSRRSHTNRSGAVRFRDLPAGMYMLFVAGKQQGIVEVPGEYEIEFKP